MVGLSRLKYILAYFIKALKNADANFKIKFASKHTHIDSQFQIIESDLEGYNCLYGNGRLYKSSVGAFSYIQYGSNISNSQIGRFCSIGPGVVIAHGEHLSNLVSTHPIFYSPSFIPEFGSLIEQNIAEFDRKVIVGSDVWIGAGCYIKDGVKIGHGSIIGAGAVVTKDIPPYSVAVGVPARIIKQRFDNEKIEYLLRLEWWDWSIEKIMENKAFFQSQDFINYRIL